MFNAVQSQSSVARCYKFNQKKWKRPAADSVISIAMFYAAANHAKLPLGGGL